MSAHRPKDRTAREEFFWNYVEPVGRWASVALAAGAAAMSLLWAAAVFWPYADVEFSGETTWLNDEKPVVQTGTLADVSFVVPELCNPGGYPLKFERDVVQVVADTDPALPFFSWPLEDPTLNNPDRLGFCEPNSPVRVVFPVNYVPGEYRLVFNAVYAPNPLSERSVPFESPTFTVVE